MSRRPTGVRFAEDVVLQTLDGEALLLKLGDEAVFSLNVTGTRIAELIERAVPPADIVEQLGREYGVSTADMTEAVHDLIDALDARGLILVERETVHGDG